MAYAAGVLSSVSTGAYSVSLSSTPATGGTGPYTYQLYKSQTVDFTPDGGSIIAGATELTYIDSDVLPGTQYYYKMVATDTGHSNDEAISNQLSILTDVGNQLMNQFSQSPFLGMLDLKFNYNTIAAKMDDDVTGGFIAGQAVKVTQQAGGVPVVEPCDDDDDVVFGFINFDIKTKRFVAGSLMEISQRGNVIYLIATAAIERGERVMIDPLTPGGVTPCTTGKPISGFALDIAAAAGALIRVELTCPAYDVLPA